MRMDGFKKAQNKVTLARMAGGSWWLEVRRLQNGKHIPARQSTAYLESGECKCGVFAAYLRCTLRN